jgi:acyl-CoA thioester hydrolase
VTSPAFDLPSPHLLNMAVDATGIDAYNHVNNAVYVTWCDRVAWSHSAALGLGIDRCLKLDRGMAVVRTVITYLRPALLNDALVIATWLLPAESRLCVRRRFQITRPSDDATLARAEIEYACIELSSGRPTRWPPEFRECYVALPEVIAAYANLAPI